ncbi:gliding motility protein [Streptomyces sp. FIT100]|uniref:gliding motility protein n=1 Tax=Streptomyces sp. FIT100 TaxID=2837956 RepID=UPI0021C62924|nr:gliding motility protein [Streptomyces sp. FIT100]
MTSPEAAPAASVAPTDSETPAAPKASSEEVASEEAKAEVEETEAAAAVPPTASPAAESVEIPRQQSVEEAADSEAGEGARK